MLLVEHHANLFFGNLLYHKLKHKPKLRCVAQGLFVKRWIVSVKIL